VQVISIMKLQQKLSSLLPKLRGCVYFIGWKLLFNEIQYPVHVWKNTFVRNKSCIYFGKNITISHNAFISPISCKEWWKLSPENARKVFKL